MQVGTQQTQIAEFDDPIVIVGGGSVDAELLRELYASGCRLIGADGGADQIVDAGLKPEVIVGDFDSLTMQHGRTQKIKGHRVSIHPLAPITFWHSDGLEYPLDAVKLAPGVRTGTSNMATTGAFAIQPEEGVQAPYLLIVDRQYLFRLVAQLLAR